MGKNRVLLEKYREEVILHKADGEPVRTWFEIRIHPLTGELSRVIHVPLRRPNPPDLKKMADETRDTCPFCPERLEKKAPRFSSELLDGGMLRHGKAVLIPNLYPYDRYCALIILSESHYVPLEDWEAAAIEDGMVLAQKFLDRVIRADAGTRAFAMNWNYAPHAGSSILHPHIQLSAGAFASNRARRLMMASREAMMRGWDNMAAWMEKEREEKTRWGGDMGPWQMTFAFAPRGRFFELNLIHESPGCFATLSNAALQHLATGVVKAFRFVRKMGFVSMNLSLFSPLREAGLFHPMISISPRACVGPYQMSDISFQMLIDEFFTLYLPEDVTERFRSTKGEAAGP
jgi:galactose-1-phosphate uridylyltransferase